MLLRVVAAVMSPINVAISLLHGERMYGKSFKLADESIAVVA